MPTSWSSPPPRTTTPSRTSSTRTEEVIDLVLRVNPDAVLVIKLTIPVGYCRSLYVKYAAAGVRCFHLLFFPEFLRESKALYDNLYPSRIIAGVPKVIDQPRFAEENAAIRAVCNLDALDAAAHTFAALLRQGAVKEDIPTLYMGMKLVVKKGHIEEARYLCVKKNKDVQQ